MKILKIIGFLLLFIVIAAGLGGLYINTALPNVGENPNIVIKSTPDRIERGRYLANHVTVCMDCHSTRDWSSFSAPLVPGTLGKGGERFDQNMGFPGEIYSPNITPHGVSSWTDGELVTAITAGVNKDGKALFPLMAYKRFGKMSKEDIYSIVAYIRSLKPEPSDIPETRLDFPVNLINKTMPERVAFEKMPNPSDSLKYGGYLVNAAGCVDCHSKTDKGQIIAGTEFGGGMEFQQPAGTIKSSNITMHKTNGIGGWSKEAFVNRFTAYADRAYVPLKLQKTQLNTPMPWTMYGGMKPGDLEAIFVYLKSVKIQDNKVK